LIQKKKERKKTERQKERKKNCLISHIFKTVLFGGIEDDSKEKCEITKKLNKNVNLWYKKNTIILVSSFKKSTTERTKS